MVVIDLHAHSVPPEALDALAREDAAAAPRLEWRDGAGWLHFPGRAPLGPVPAGMFDPERRLADMDRQGVDVQVIAVPPPHFFYHLPPGAGAAFAAIHNDALTALSAAQPDRLQVFATLPLQDPGAAVAEIDRLTADANVRGVQIGTNVAGRDLDDPALDPVWAALAAADLPLWLHPDQRHIAGAERLARYYLQNLIGNPLESTIAIASLIFGGVLTRHADLRVGVVHGGGFVPYQIGRWDHGWGCRPEPRATLPEAPGAVLGRMFFDSLTHDAMSLAMLGARVGWDHVVVGSDYPFDMAADDPVGAVDAMRLDDADRRAVLSGTAERFLRPATAVTGARA